MKTSHALTVAIAVLCALLFIFWMAGYNFDHRGADQAFAAALSMFLTTAAFALAKAFK